MDERNVGMEFPPEDFYMPVEWENTKVLGYIGPMMINGLVTR